MIGIVISFFATLSYVSAQGAGDGHLAIGGNGFTPASSTYTYDPVSYTSTEPNFVVASSECNVERCLMSYQSSVATQSPRFKRCHALRRLEFCMKKVPFRCEDEDRRYILIDTKRRQSGSIFNCGFREETSQRVDLIAAIPIDLPNGVVYTRGYNDHPSFMFGNNAYIDVPVKGNFPSQIPTNFALRTTLRPSSAEGGYIFSVSDGQAGNNTRMALAVAPSINPSYMLVQLFLNQNRVLYLIAEFEVPSFAEEWTTLAISSKNGEISLYFNCRKIAQRVIWFEPNNIIIPNNHQLLIGSNGEKNRKFVGIIQELDIVANPDDAASYCDDRTIVSGQDYASGEEEEETLVPTDEEESDEDYLNSFDGEDHSTNKEEAEPVLNTGETVIVAPTVRLTAEKGEKGEPGIDGKNGYDGIPGRNGDTGATGSKGDQGEKGAKGDPGIGQVGEQGPVGEPGQKGEPGETSYPLPPVLGPPGKKGEKGEQGDPGRDGEDGSDGEDGQKGEPGLPGSTEFDFSDLESSGMQGLVGADGPPGPIGPMGAKGDPGEPGIGQPGQQGERGLKGEPGSKGEPGLPGLNGKDGATGEAGLIGPQGLKGVKGDRGQDGMVGAPGPPGPAGVCYQPSQFSNFPSDDEDAESSGELDLSSLPNECHGAVGPPGVPGAAGPPGLDGIDGLPGVKGDKGDNGSRGLDGINGEKGERGKSGLPGKPGIPGETGAPGLNGRNGIDGLPGSEGPRGVSGPKGEPGLPGPPGSFDKLELELLSQTLKGQKGEPGAILAPDGDLITSGDIGEPGPQGARGLKGIKGEMGVPGRSGSPGIDGKDGIKGDKGDQGYPGRDGPEGKQGLPGPPGPPASGGGWFGGGSSEKGEKGSKGEIGMPGIPGRPGPVGPQGPSGVKGEPGDFSKRSDDNYKVFRDVNEMQYYFSKVAEGTFAFVTASQELYVKTRRGWSRIMLNTPLVPPDPNFDVSTISTTTTTTTTSLSTTTATTPARSLSRPSRGLHLVALNFPLRGSMGGIKEADSRCFKQARQAGLHGTYRAFLSSRDQHVASIVSGRDKHSVPVVNANGEVLFNNWLEMFNGSEARIDPNKIYSFQGRKVMDDARWPMKLIWHGSNFNGKMNSMHNCASWYTHNTAVTGLASSLTRHKLLNGSVYPCRFSFVVLCIENSARTLRVKRR